MNIHLRELVFYDRNPKSMRTVPGVCPAGGAFVPVDPADLFQIIVLFHKISGGPN